VDSFAFIIHPIDPKHDIARKYPFLARIVNDWIIYKVAPYFPPVYLSEVEGITSASTGKRIKGWLIACPLIPNHFLQLPEKRVYRKIIETGRLAERLGAKILGLGAYTSVVGDAGKTVAQNLTIPVTTGDSYTVSVAVQAVEQAARKMEIAIDQSVAAVVGATGAIGRACSEVLSRRVNELYLVARHQAHLELLREKLMTEDCRARLHISTRMDVLKNAQLVLSVTSSMKAVIEPEHLRSGSVICDIARPRDVSQRVAALRDDVLVIDGGMVHVPGQVDFHFDFGLPSGKAYACMAETIALTLEGRFEDYTIGKEIEIEKVDEINRIANKHGFQIYGIRSFERNVTEEEVERIRQNARRSYKHS